MKTPDEIKKFVNNMRVCCGDVILDDEDDCARFCSHPQDMRNGELRFCREWLIKDAADLIEQLSAKLEKVMRERDMAVQDIEYLLSDGSASCDFCKRMESCKRDGTENVYCEPIWRGTQKNIKEG